VSTGIGIVHVHSNYSHDGMDPLERLRDFALDRGISFVGMTDHAEDFDPSRFVEYREHCQAVSDASVQVIPGLEYRFAGYPGLHLLALGLDRMIVPRTPEDFCRLTAGTARFTIVAHPILPRYQIPVPVADVIDAIEIWNAAYNTRYLPDTKAIRLYHKLRQRRPEVVATFGLDQHDSRNDRETRVHLLDRSAADPLGELKAGRFTNQGRTLRMDSRATCGPLRLGALSAARWSLDRMNDVHDRAVRLARAAIRGRR
jgi:PHP domain